MTTERVPGAVVRVKFGNRRQLRQAFLRDLSQGSLFVRTDTPLPDREAVLLILELPDGAHVEVNGEVGYVVPPHSSSPGGPAGMSVTLRDFTIDKRSKIEELLQRPRTLVPISGPINLPGTPPSGPHLPVPAMDILVRGLRRLVWLCGDAEQLAEIDYYQILGLPPNATTDEIREACTILRVLLEPGSPPEGLADRMTDEQRARVGELHDYVSEIERTLTNATRRARYDAEVFSIVR